jgi:dolichyl-phosphate-mannose--protein O-mannosyl transferase
LLLKRPVAYFFTDEGGIYREILALGNPLTWWPSVLALLAGIGFYVRSRTPGARSLLTRPEPVLLAAVVATYGPWLLLSGSRSQVFLWYLLPTIPFLCIALAQAGIVAWRWTAGRVAVGAMGVAIVASLVWFGPLLVALPLNPGGWRDRMLFTDCVRPDASAQALPDDETSSGLPPDGWCWI